MKSDVARPMTADMLPAVQQQHDTIVDINYRFRLIGEHGSRFTKYLNIYHKTVVTLS